MPPEMTGQDDQSENTTATTALPASPTSLEMPPVAAERPGQDFERLYNQMRGTYKSAQAQWDGWRGEAQEVNTQQQAKIAALNAQVVELSGQLVAAQTRIAELSPLQAESATAKAEAEALTRKVDQMSRFVRRPHLVLQGTEVELKDDAGQLLGTEYHNPYLDLILASTLEAEPLDQMLAELEAKVGTVQANGKPLASIVQAPAPPGKPASAEVQRATLIEQAKQASLAGNYAEANRLAEEAAKLRQ